MKPLPLDCEASFLADFLSPAESTALFDELVDNYPLSDRKVTLVDGTEHLSDTGAYLFADGELTSYEHFPELWGGRSAWPASLASVRDRIHDLLGHRFPVARAIHYADGSVGMAFHSDLVAYGPTDAIASLSLGAERQFAFRNIDNPDQIYSLALPPGSLVFMGKNCQDRYQHGIIEDPTCTAPRINLTFRKYGWD